jgi:hypothetical protein
MGEVFTLVVVGAIALFAFVGVVSWLMGGSIYDQIGQGGLTAGPGPGGGGFPPSPAPGSQAELRERELEIRQMLQARSDRLVRGGGQPLDIDAELARLTGSEGAPGDPLSPPAGSQSARGGPQSVQGGPQSAQGGPQSAPAQADPSSKSDPGLAEEVRQLVLARNERRARRGEPPLDVEAEVQRTLDELQP